MDAVNTLSHSRSRGRRRQGNRTGGFTLLEVLVSVGIFAMIGVGSSQLLRTIVDTRDLTEGSSARIMDLQRAMASLDRDLAQFTFRAIRDEYGEERDALLVGGDLYVLEFSRVGWRNPRQLPRSNIQRVAYQSIDGEFIRHFWFVLDRAEDAEPMTQVLLRDVVSVRVNVLDDEGNASDVWPQFDNSSAKKAIALEIFIDTEDLGEVRKVVRLPAVARRVATPGETVENN